ncbi:MAG TPA: phospholipid carrier-dependent glycosyltransferase [Chloroflexia bacterium]|jgi:4-amino-4-deoxy-L-arabinose transferase-like glycosyltransferase
MLTRLSPHARRLRSGIISVDFLIMAALFLFAFALRWYGISGSLPYVAHPDEPKVIDSAIHIVKSGDLNPNLYIWPSLYIYIQALLLQVHVAWGTLRGYYEGAASLPDVTHIFTLDSSVYIWARTLAAAIGAITIPVLYHVGKEMFNDSRRVGLAAALMLAVSPLHVQYSHFALMDAPLGLMGIFVLWASYRLSRTSSSNRPLLRDPLFWQAALAGLLVGVATGTKYNGLYLGVVPFIALIMAWRRNRSSLSRGRLVGTLVSMGGFAALGFLLGEPYMLLDWPAFYNGFTFQVQAYLPAENLGQVIASIQRHVTDLAASDMHFFMPAMLGAFVVLANAPVRNRSWLLLIFPVLYLLAMSRFSLTYVRNMIVTLPFLAILSGYVIDLVAMQLTTLARGYAGRIEDRRVWNGVRWGIVGVVLLFVTMEPLRISGNYSASMADPDTRNLAWYWMQTKMREGYRFAAELHPWQVQDWPDVLAFDVENPGDTEELTARPPEWYARYGYDYVVLNSNLKDWQRDATSFAMYQALPVAQRYQGDQEGGNKGPTMTIISLHEQQEEPRPAPAAREVQALIEDFAVLRGFDLSPLSNVDTLLEPGTASNGATYTPGQAVGLNMYYRAHRDGRPTDSNWQVWIHLVDPATEQTVAQLDVQPLAGMLKQHPIINREPHPVRDWHQGELLAGIYNFPLPADLKLGKYRLETGMWVPPNGPGATVRLQPGNETADRIVLGEIEVH